MGIVVITNVEDAIRVMRAYPAKAKKALSQALTFAAKIAQGHVIQDLPKHFKIRSRWVPGSIRLRPLDDLSVVVGVLQGSAFMVMQELGGTKSEKGTRMAVPIGPASSHAKGEPSMPFRGQDQMKQTLRGRWPSQLKKSFVIKTSSGKSIVVISKGKGNKHRLQVAYVLKRRVRVKARWNFRQTVTETAKAYVPRLFMGYLGRGL